MKRFHVHLHVTDLAKNIAFYSRLFDQPPSRVEHDYAKWMLQDPPVNFAISTRGSQPGVDHLGFQVETDAELQTLKARAAAADLALLDEGQTTCCYARSDKYWITDPQGLAWEQFRTLDSIPVFREGPAPAAAACCAPPSTASCCGSEAVPASAAATASGCCTPPSTPADRGTTRCC
jgi:catechol 2,3-dioxygenase-like lactoylglutathione lyase family enzyme